MPHTMTEARAVLAESRRLLRQDLAARQRTVDVRAAGTPKPRPAPAAAAAKPAAPKKGFMDFVAEEMGTGKTRSQAIRAAAIGRPDLHRAYLADFNAGAREREQRTRDRAAAARAKAARR